MTAPTPRDTGPALDPRAVKAAADHLARPGGWNLWPADAHRIAADAVTAAAPILLAAERQRIAAAIRVGIDEHAYPGSVSAWRNAGLSAAARIAESDPEETP